jgi:hypothetical protein
MNYSGENHISYMHVHACTSGIISREMGFGFVMAILLFQHIFEITFSLQQTCFLAEYFGTRFMRRFLIDFMLYTAKVVEKADNNCGFVCF